MTIPITMEYYHNERAGKARLRTGLIENFSQENSSAARRFLSRLEGYAPTPLSSLPALADRLAVRSILVKDESGRLGLKAFKVTGGAWAVGRFLSEKLGIKTDQLFPGDALKKQVESRCGRITFATGSSGNHGTGLAWAARQFGQKAVIALPKGAPRARRNTLTSLGAEVIQTDKDYDGTVAWVRQTAEQKNWQVIADTGWEGYEKIPTWIMEGYTVIFNEVREQLAGGNLDRPTHIFIQGGVGSFSASAAAYFSLWLEEERPRFIVVEPATAACLMESARQADGRPHRSKGKIDTVMAGLGCAEPNPVAWPILFDCADTFISCRDTIAEDGMRIYARPAGDDTPIVSGASGAAGMGVFYRLMTDKSYKDIKGQLGIDKNSIILLFNTEGDTDPDHYRHVLQSPFVGT